MLDAVQFKRLPVHQFGSVRYFALAAEAGRSNMLLRFANDQEHVQTQNVLERQVARLAAWNDNRFPCAVGLKQTTSGLALQFAAADKQPLFVKYAEGIDDYGLLLDLCQQLGALHGFLMEEGYPQFGQSLGLVFVDDADQVSLLGVDVKHAVSFASNATQLWQQVSDMVPFLSPEHQIDHYELDALEVEMYALGVAFFKLACGRFPFVGDTVAEVCHQHMAEAQPQLLVDGKPLPRSFDSIVNKLLSKDPQNRYHAFDKLLADLRACQEIWSQYGAESQDMVLHQRPPTRTGSKSLYGRAAEVTLLNGLCEQVARGESAIVTIAGYSGIGKSSLADVAGKAIASYGGVMITGKFDQAGISSPYAPLVDAFGEWVYGVLGAEDSQVEHWAQQLNDALAPKGRVLTELIPDLEVLMGNQPQVPEIPPGETQNRFLMTFNAFLNCLSQDTPLVLFLDDLQWADPASLQLLQQLLSKPPERRLLVILAYRDNEVGVSHPFNFTLRKLRETGSEIHHLVLKQLSLSEVNQIIAEQVASPIHHCEPLSKYIYEKTNGNPFFTLQLLQSLVDNQTVYFDVGLKQWRWNEKQLAKCQYTENVVDLMVARIHKLPVSVQEWLMFGACIGNDFDLETLQAVHTSDEAKILEDLRVAQKAGLLVPVNKRKGKPRVFRFAHDRVQQAAYSMQSGTSKKALHLKIGMQLWRASSAQGLSKRLFEIVDQVNRGITLIEDESTRQDLAHLNLRACLRAKKTNAYQNAVNYAQTGCELLTQDAWEKHYKLAFSLKLERLRLLYLLNETTNTEHYCNELLQHVATQYDRLMVRETMITFLNIQGKFKETIALAKQTLAEMEIELLDEIPRQAPPAAIHEVPNEVLSYGDILNLPPIRNKKIERAMHLLLSVLPAAYHSDPGLFRQLVFTLLDLSLRFGNSEASAGAFSTFGLALRRTHPKQINASYDYGRLSLKLLERFPVKSTGTIVHGTYNITIRHWCEPAHNSWRALTDSARASIDLGNYEQGMYHITFATSLDFYLGSHLSEVLERAEHAIQLTQALQTEVNVGFVQAWHGVAQSFISGPEAHFYIGGPFFDERRDPPELLAKDQPNGVFIMWMGKAMLAYFFGNSEAARAFFEKSKAYSGTLDLMIDAWQHVFYEALILLDTMRIDGSKHYVLLERVECLAEQLKAWEAHCPDNFSNKCALIEAEKAWVMGDTLKAMRAFDQAIELSERQRFLHEAGLASERAGLFYQSQGLDRFTKLYAHEAVQYYALWGADAKRDHCAERFGIIAPIFNSARDRKSAALEQTLADVDKQALIGLSVLDSCAVVQAYRVLAREVMLQPLLEKFLAIAVRNAGAQRGYIVLKKEDHLDFENALGFPDQTDSAATGMAKSIALYVARTHRDVLLEDASLDPLYRDDTYVMDSNLRSVLCFALIHKQQFFGVLYLENNLMPGSFTQTRVEVLRLLMAQAVISIDNANLYRNMEALIEARTQALREVQHQLVHTGKLAAIGELASGVAHELNQPLAFVRGGAQLELMNLNMGDFEPKSIKETLDQVVMGTDRMMKIVNHLRDFARATDFNAPVPVNIHQVIENALMMTSQQFKHRNIEVSCTFASDDLSVPGYADKLEQVLINLLCNARDALGDTEEPRIQIHTGWCALDETVDSLEILVRDNGAGMSQTVLDQVFTPYFTTKGNGEGTGLGLAISQRIIEEHGGQISVTSQVGEGTCFRLQLPSLLTSAVSSAG